MMITFRSTSAILGRICAAFLITSPAYAVDPKPGTVSIVSLADETPEVREVFEKTIRDMTMKGYRDVGPEIIDAFSNFRFQQIPLRKVDDLKKGLTFRLAELGEAFKGLKLEGGITDGPLNGPWTGIKRYFTFKEEHDSRERTKPTRGFERSDSEPDVIVKLSEVDYVTAQTGVSFTREMLNENVHGVNAVYAAVRDPRGKLIGTLQWATEKKLFEIEMTGSDKSKHALKDLRKTVLKLARAVDHHD